MEDAGVGHGGGVGGDMEEGEEGLEAGEGELEAEELGCNDEGFLAESFGGEGEGDEPEDSGDDSDKVGADEEGHGEGEGYGEGAEGFDGAGFRAGGGDEGASEDGGARVSGGGGDDDVSAADFGVAASVRVDGDVVGGTAGEGGGEGVGELVEVGIEVGEGEEEGAEEGDGPDEEAEGGGDEEELLRLGHRRSCLGALSGGVVACLASGLGQGKRGVLSRVQGTAEIVWVVGWIGTSGGREGPLAGPRGFCRSRRSGRDGVVR